ncbi:hypothetical protein LBMAG42_32900 [Deltaproteobacteria bacterium]|nr:hypothetical protein LBMAG42_32900 [Deltaproteobacteria bacterium]
MKIAAGCFGCLALVCLALAVLGYSGLQFVAEFVPSDMQGPVTSIFGALPSVGGSCCCLSGALSIILFAVGMSRGNNDAIE